MDGYFLRDDDIIGDDPTDYKPFDLVDWKVSPTTDFSFEAPELNFPTENLLDRASKGDNTLEDSDSWISVLNTKEPSWAETKTKLVEEGYLNEQVVPDQGQELHQLDHKTKSLQIQEIQSNFSEISKDSFTKENHYSPIQISTNEGMDNGLERALTPENLSKSMFIVEHKEQVKSEEEAFEIPPAKVLFSFNYDCKEKSVEKTTKTSIQEELPTELLKDIVGETLSSSTDGMLIRKVNNQLNTQNSELCGILQSAKLETNIEIKSEENQLERSNCEQNANENKIFKVREKILKLLNTTKIPKCTMVDYKFDSSEKLPSFVETFCPDLSREKSNKPREIELPCILTNEEDKDEEIFITLPDSDSEIESSDTEQSAGPDQISEESQRPKESNESPKVKIKTEVMQEESEISNKGHADTPSSMLVIDDEWEKYLVSSIMLNDTTQNSSSQLPDLSNNIGSILTTEGLSEENSMESVYGNLFSKPGLQTEKVENRNEEQNMDLKLAETLDFRANILNSALLEGEKTWQAHVTQDNANTLYGNIWTRSTANEGYANQINSRPFTNDVFDVSDPFMNSTDFKATAGLPAEIMETDIDPFKFSSLVPKVEVVDSSLNYSF